LLEVAPSKEEKALHFGVRVPLFLRWAALRLSTERPVRMALIGKKGLASVGAEMAAQDTAFLHCHGAARDALANGLHQQLRHFFCFADDVRAQRKRYSPNASWVAASEALDDGEAVISAWQGSSHSIGERDYAPGYAGLLARGWNLRLGSKELAGFREDALDLFKMLPPEMQSAKIKGSEV